MPQESQKYSISRPETYAKKKKKPLGTEFTLIVVRTLVDSSTCETGRNPEEID